MDLCISILEFKFKIDVKELAKDTVFMYFYIRI
ncbi:hypothetical protein HMPREF1767_01398 [Fusobacterium nucleatum CTI-6]|uniref:Uncharacterized protein n=1 Tax=Fusobacterium nucleatum CTI-6 TaxID=1316587 RepID=U7TVE9_FUSNU|nr:hypothetical protein HMPREF1767_01398 [Fusobacterium nucleatum CTI-6]